MTHLAGLTVLLTRPQGQQASLATAIKQAGGHCVLYPVMAIKALDEQQDRTLIQQCREHFKHLETFHHIIFISCNAVRFGLKWLTLDWPQWPRHIMCHAIGSATQQALINQGIPCTIHSHPIMNSEALLQHPALQQLNNQNILIVRGVGGRDYLAKQLQQRGAHVQYAQCYRRTMVDRPPGELGQLIHTAHVNVIIIHSGESLNYCLTLAGNKHQRYIQSLTMVVPSERVADLAKRAGLTRIRVANNATDAAMLEALKAIRNLT